MDISAGDLVFAHLVEHPFLTARLASYKEKIPNPAIRNHMFKFLESENTVFTAQAVIHPKEHYIKHRRFGRDCFNELEQRIVKPFWLHFGYVIMGLSEMLAGEQRNLVFYGLLHKAESFREAAGVKIGEPYSMHAMNDLKQKAKEEFLRGIRFGYWEAAQDFGNIVARCDRPDFRTELQDLFKKYPREP